MLPNGKNSGRGRGAGRGGGGVDRCVCPKCGHEEPHQRGIPCAEKTCPECGSVMIGKR